MKTIIEYQCELCNKKYSTKEEALKCEAQGEMKKEDFPIGMMRQYEHHGFVGIFALAQRENWPNNKHLIHGNWWACRAPHLPGDSLGKEVCGGDFLYNKTFSGPFGRIKKEHENGPEFKRMVAYLKENNIVPQYYNEAGELIKL